MSVITFEIPDVQRWKALYEQTYTIVSQFYEKYTSDTHDITYVERTFHRLNNVEKDIDLEYVTILAIIDKNFLLPIINRDVNPKDSIALSSDDIIEYPLKLKESIQIQYDVIKKTINFSSEIVKKLLSMTVDCKVDFENPKEILYNLIHNRQQVLNRDNKDDQFYFEINYMFTVWTKEENEFERNAGLLMVFNK